MSDNNIDFENGNIRQTFLKMLWPTLAGMISMVVLNLTDGAFVGHGAGSNALAAVNIVAPVFLLAGGIALMFGMGSSVVASILMSRGKHLLANINITQAIIGAETMSLVLAALLLIFPKESCRLFGSSETLLPLATTYLFWIALFQPLSTMSSLGVFLIRLDGRPKVAMWIMTGCAISNMFLDWLLIYPLDMGIEGASIATGFSFALGGVVALIYMLGYSKGLYICRVNVLRRFQMTAGNMLYQMKLGASAFFGDVAIAFLLVIGNYIFMRYLGEDGVAAFSIACYCTPVVFSISNAVVVSAQPLISFAYGVGNHKRMYDSILLSVTAALIVGFGGFLLLSSGAGLIASIFLPYGCGAYHLALQGLPLFGSGFIFIALNLVCVGIMQSIERARMASVITLLRGYILLAATFAILPEVWGTEGIWMSTPVAEALTFVTVVILLYRSGVALVRNARER